jgi:hypothetical protein
MTYVMMFVQLDIDLMKLKKHAFHALNIVINVMKMDVWFVLKDFISLRQIKDSVLNVQKPI